MSTSSDRHDIELARLLDDLSRLRLTAGEWEGVHSSLRSIDDSEPAVEQVSQVVFEANVPWFSSGRR